MGESSGWRALRRRMMALSAGAVVSCSTMLTSGVMVSSSAWGVTPEEYADLAPEVALQLPMVEALPVFGWSRKEYYFIIENALIDLRYYYGEPVGASSPKLMSAIRSFQSAMQHAPTGSLRVNEFVELVERTNSLWQVPILPPRTAVIREGDVVSLEGTWVSEQVRDPDPVQTAQVRCRQSTGQCTMAIARVHLNDAEGTWFHSNSGDLEVRMSELKVTRWDEHGIEAQYRPYFCITDTLVIDLRTDEARILRDRARDNACADVKTGRDTLRLVDGDTAAAAFWEQRRDRAHQLRSRAFRERVDEIQRARRR